MPDARHTETVRGGSTLAAVDLSLVILFVLAALYAGAVIFLVLLRRRGLLRAAVSGVAVTAGVAASLFSMVLLAHLSLAATVAVVAVFAGAVAYLVMLRDLGRPRAALSGVGAAVLISLCFAFVSYLAVLALVGAAGVYLLLRLWLRTRPALLVMGGTLGGLLAASAFVFAVALSTM
jgi:hypothetical protein